MSPEPGELQGVEIRHLEAFLLVAEELNFTHAAERLHLAQQALSARIRQLEDRLGVELFRRDTRSVELTSAGEAFLEPAAAALAEVVKAVGAVAQVRRGEAGRLVVGLTAMTALSYAQEVVQRFRDERPAIELDVRTIPWPDASAGVATGIVDVGVVRPPFAGSDVRLQPLRAEARVAVLPTSHPLASRDEVRAQEIADEPWVDLPDADPAFEAFWTLADHREGPKVVGARIADFDEMFMAVAAGRALAVVPEGIAGALSASWPGLRFLRIADVEPSVVAVAWRADRETPLVRAFAAVARRLHEEAAGDG